MGHVYVAGDADRGGDKDRWLMAEELLTAMGYPIDIFSQRATGGALTQFSEGARAFLKSPWPDQGFQNIN